MESDVSQEYQEYLNEFRFLQDETDDKSAEEEEEEEGAAEAAWLRAAGLGRLSEAWRGGREVAAPELDGALRSLSRAQADAVRRRVHALNRTLRTRRPRKHVRDLFADVENSSTGTRSRSATPDSLDSETAEEQETTNPQLIWPHPGAPQMFHRHLKSSDWNQPETPPSRSYSTKVVHLYPNTNDVADFGFHSQSKHITRRQPPNSAGRNFLFSHPGAWGSNKGSLAMDNDGIKILNYHMIGTVHLPRPKEKLRSNSDPTAHEDSNNNRHYLSTNKVNGVPPSNISALVERNKAHSRNTRVTVTRSHSNLYHVDRQENSDLYQRIAGKNVLRRSGSHGHLGFGELFSQAESHRSNSPPKNRNNSVRKINPVGRTWIEFLGDDDITRLKPLLLLEVTALLDNHGIAFEKRKAPKRKRKEEGNVFGVSLLSLLQKDQQLTQDTSQVPLIFQKLFSFLERGGIKEEGILRIAGHQQKVELLCSTLERSFYTQPEMVDQVLQQSSCHDIAAVVKRLLKNLPQPLFTAEYIHTFYQVHAIQEPEEKVHALNLLVLLLPTEARNTLQALFHFLLQVVQHQSSNKMDIRNVSTIIAPSLFSPRYIHPEDKNDLTAQVQMAAVCCALTETMLKCGDKLWVVPEELINQIRRQSEEEIYKKGYKENNKPKKKLLGRKGIPRDLITRKIDNEVDFQNGVIRVNAPQFKMMDVPVQLSSDTTAGDVILRIVEEATKYFDNPGIDKKLLRRPQDKLLDLAPNGNLSCFLATSSPEMTLQTHYLYEIGGNIAQRQVEHDAIMMAVYQENPNSQWTLRCHHKNGNNSVQSA